MSRGECVVEVSVAIPTYNRREKLRRLLHSLEKSTSKDFEVIVVDDASVDGTEEMVRREFPYVRYLRHKEPTLVAKSRNDAIEASEGDFVFFIDDDNVVEPGTIGKLLDYMKRHDEVGTAGPVTCYYSMPGRIMYAGSIFSKLTRRTISLYSGLPCEALDGKVVDVDAFANSYMIRREAARRAGPIPWRRIPWNGEDGYLHYRIKRLGYRNVTVGSAKVYHDVDPEEGMRRYNEFRLYYAMRSKIIFHRDLDSPANKAKFFVSLPTYAMYYIYVGARAGIAMSGAEAVLEGLLDGLLGKEGLRYI
jgi:GT2 family glycosyltransferase